MYAVVLLMVIRSVGKNLEKLHLSIKEDARHLEASLKHSMKCLETNLSNQMKGIGDRFSQKSTQNKIKRKNVPFLRFIVQFFQRFIPSKNQQSIKMTTPNTEKLQAEVDANFEVFDKMSFKESDKGKFTLLRKRKLITIFDTHKECRVIRPKKFADGLYSIQETMPKMEYLEVMH